MDQRCDEFIGAHKIELPHEGPAAERCGDCGGLVEGYVPEAGGANDVAVDRRLVVRIGDVHDLPDFVGQTLEDRLRRVRHEVEQGWAFGAREGARSPALFEFRCADEAQFGLVFLMSFGVSAVSLPDRRQSRRRDRIRCRIGHR